MPRDYPGRAQSSLPPWLDASLTRALAGNVASARARGASQASIARECREQALACRPAWPMPWIEEVAAIALWAGGVDGSTGGR